MEVVEGARTRQPTAFGHLKEAKRNANLEVGDICLLNYDNKIRGTYRLCCVLTTRISAGGLVRTGKVGYKDRRRVAGKNYKPGSLTEIEVGVQHLVLLVPANEAELMKESAMDEPAPENHDLEPKDGEDYAPEVPAEEGDLEDDTTNVPRRRSQRFNNKTKKVMRF